MIVKKLNEYQINNDKNIVNSIKWSIAGGNTRIVTYVMNTERLLELMESFINDCREEETVVIPLENISRQFFEENSEYHDVLRTLDVHLIEQYFK